MFTDYYLAGVMDNTTVRYTRLQLSHIRQATAQPMFTPQLDGRAHDPLAPSFIPPVLPQTQQGHDSTHDCIRFTAPGIIHRRLADPSMCCNNSRRAIKTRRLAVPHCKWPQRGAFIVYHFSPS